MTATGHLPPATCYAELHAHSYYSLLDGASSPEALLDRAAALGMPALALTDHDALYGAVRFWQAARERGVQAVIGAEVTVEGGGGGRVEGSGGRVEGGEQGVASRGQGAGSKGQGAGDNVQRATCNLQPSTCHLVLLAETQEGYANLCRLLSHAHLTSVKCQVSGVRCQVSPETGNVTPDTTFWPGKAEPVLDWETLAHHREGLVVLTGCRQGPLAASLLAGQPEQALAHAERLRDIFGRDRCFVELQRHLLPDEPPLIRGLLEIARRLDLPVVATNNVHYAEREGHRLQDVMVCIRHLTSLDEAGHLLRPNSEYHLKSGVEMARLFPGLPQALSNTLAIAERCQVSLDFSGQCLPAFPVPERHTPFSYLYDLCQQGLHRKYRPVTPATSKQLAYELDVIERSGLAGYFLIVWDIVQYANRQGIRYQGRGSAANSLVAYLLDITPVDPLRFNLLFDRFLSPDSHTMPDIDIDFAADRREEVIQYVYECYGSEHTAMVCNVNTFQSRSALRDVGRALGLKPEMIEMVGRREQGAGSKWQVAGGRWQVAGFALRTSTALSRTLSPKGGGEQEAAANNVQPANVQPATCERANVPTLQELCAQLQGAPRHLSIHVGGMIITARPLVEIVPLERATMPGRVVVQWDKDSVEDAGLIKIDLLGLRTLGMVSEIAGLVAERSGQASSLDDLTLDDPAVYDTLCRGDTIGAFQVESRAQSQMLPRLRPRRFEDIVVEVAIVRPGPIQGDMVHPYLRRRQGLEPVVYAHPSLEPILAETLGVILFQEQVLRVAMAVAGFSGGEADRLRRAMSRQRSQEEMRRLGERFVVGAMANGLDQETAITIFGQLAGFASYGFCKSHAAAFALLSYQTMWLRLYHPAEFYCALLNHQPMGFYSPAVVMGDARRHGVSVLPPDLNRSQESCALEGDAIRLGLRYIKGVGPAARQQLLAKRASPYRTLRDLCLRTRLPRDVVDSLIRSGACDGLSPDRRRLLWELGALDYSAQSFDLEADLDDPGLPALTEAESMGWDLDQLGMTPGDHLMRLYRPHLQAAGILSAAELDAHGDGERVRVAGQVVVRQSPPTAKGHLFITLEDETGLVNLIVRPALFARQREVLRYALLLAAAGRLQREGEACSVLVARAWALPNGLE